MIKTTFRIEVLSLPQIDLAHVPNSDVNADPIIDEEKQMLTAITERRILWEYTPPAPPVADAPPPPRFDHNLHCYVIAIVETDGKPQCWIDLRTRGETHFLFEEQSFRMGTTPTVIKKIEVNKGRIQVSAAGSVFAFRLGKNFDEYDDMCYFLTDILDENGAPWSADSTGEPRCVIVHGSEIEEGDDVKLLEKAKYVLSVSEAFPMQEVSCTVKAIDPSAEQVQIEAVGTVYTVKVGGSFSEFGSE